MFKNTTDWTISSRASEESEEGSTTRVRSPERAVKPHERAAVKRCRKCGETKPRTEFYPVGGKCKVCFLAQCKVYNARPEVIERRHARQKAHYEANKDRIQSARKERQTPERKAAFLEYLKSHYNANRAMYAAKVGKRRAARVQATPKWADGQAMRRFYEEARRLTLETGVKHVVDHIIPLQGKEVCGLHVPQNLRVITEAENLAKFNRVIEEIV